MEIGIDIEQNERFKTLTQTCKKRTFTENELSYAKKTINEHERLCAMWCVKEATIKAFSNTKISYKEIETCVDENGKPFVVKNETVLNELKKLGMSEIKISLSHTKDYSTAICLIY